jgi:hypothetical protein
MPELQAATRFVWAGAETGTISSDIQAAVRFSWADNTAVPNTVSGFIQSVGSAYTRPTEDPVVVPPPQGSLAARTTIPAQSVYDYPVALAARDLRDDAAFTINSVTMELSEGSIVWTLSASSEDDSVYARLTTGEQPPTVAVTLGSEEWHFVLDRVSLAAEHARQTVSFGGRSLAALADAPRQAPRQWIADAPTTVAQIVTLAQTFTGLNVTWLAPDWPVPKEAWSYFGSPLDVVRQATAAIGGVAEASKSGNSITVRTKYPAQPTLWSSVSPEWQIPWEFVDTSSSENNDSAEYNGVFVAGQQQGGLADVRLAGTAGDAQAPMVTDPLLTDLVGVVERATSILFSAGRKTRVTRTMLVPSQGVIGREQLVRWVDPTETWVGLVRGITVTASFGQARQTVTVERRTSYPVGTFVPEPVPPAPGELPPRLITVAIQTAPASPVVLPTHAAGDLLVMWMRAASGDTPPATPSGWTSHCTSSAGTHRGWRVVSRVDGDNSIISVNEADQMWVAICRTAAVGTVTAGAYATGTTVAFPDMLLSRPGLSLVLSGAAVSETRDLSSPVDQTKLTEADFAGGTWAVWVSPPGQSNYFNNATAWSGSANGQAFALELTPAPA